MRKKTKKTAKKFPIIDKVILAINILCALCLLLSYLAPDTDPRDYSIIALLGFGYIPLLLTNIILIIYWGIRKNLLFLISAVSILTGINVFLYFFQFGNDSEINKKPLPNELRMMAYNVRQFKGIEKFEELPIQNEVFKIIKDQHPDIINFEEFSLTSGEKISITDTLHSFKYKYSFFKAFYQNRTDTIGNAIFSKYPIIDTGSIPSPAMLYTRTIFADIKYNNQTIRVYCVHLAAVTMAGNEKSKYLNGQVSLASSSFIGNKLSAAFIARSLQVSRIKAHMEKCPFPYIVAGDFNDTPNSFAVNTLGDGLKNSFREKGHGFETTYYSSFPLHIDHLFASPQFDILSYRAIDKKVSDHKAIVADLKFNQ
jgi:endonuclease/exonuclease/phosphatase family metal-dependent hydrolase